jgi:hypothetical protein
MPDRARGVLRGQVTFNPHRTREAGRTAAADVEMRVMSPARMTGFYRARGATSYGVSWDWFHRSLAHGRSPPRLYGGAPNLAVRRAMHAIVAMSSHSSP